MRVAVALILFVFSGVAFGDSYMKVKPKKSHKGQHEYQDERHGRERGHERGHYSHERGHDSHERDHNYRSDERWWISFGFGDRYSTRSTQPRYYPRYHHRTPPYHYGVIPYRRNSVHDYDDHDWIGGHRFSTGPNLDRGHEHVFHVGRQLNAISLTGYGRDSEVVQAWAELKSGRIVPLYELEGRLSYGKRKGHYFYFDEPRYVQKIFITAESGNRHHGAEIELSYVIGR